MPSAPAEYARSAAAAVAACLMGAASGYRQANWLWLALAITLVYRPN